MPSNKQVHTQVPLNDANISETTKLTLNNLLKKFDSIILKSDNDIGQRDLIEMHIATMLILKHYDFLKQEIKNLLGAGIICTTTTSATGTKKGPLALMPLLKIDELFTLLKGAKYFIALDL